MNVLLYGRKLMIKPNRTCDTAHQVLNALASRVPHQAFHEGKLIAICGAANDHVRMSSRILSMWRQAVGAVSQRLDDGLGTTCRLPCLRSCTIAGKGETVSHTRFTQRGTAARYWKMHAKERMQTGSRLMELRIESEGSR